MNISSIINNLKPYMGRLVFTALGFASAVSFLVFGFGRTMLLLLCTGIGYLLGSIHDNNIDIVGVFKRLRGKL